MYGKKGDLTKLEALAKKYERNIDAQKFLARIYQKYDEPQKAAILFEIAADRALNKHDKLKLYGNATVSFMKSGQRQDADKAIKKMMAFISEVENGEVEIIPILCELAEIKNDQDLYFGLAERSLQINPDNTDFRFSLAYNLNP